MSSIWWYTHVDRLVTVAQPPVTAGNDRICQEAYQYDQEHEEVHKAEPMAATVAK